MNTQAGIMAEMRTKAESFKTTRMLELALSCIDLTTLNATDSVTHIRAFTGRVNDFEDDYPSLPNVAAICVYPNMVQTVKETLKSRTVRIAAVAGGFPASMTFLEMKVNEAVMAVEFGADEIDIVIPLWAFLDGNTFVCHEEIATIKAMTSPAHLKVILETGVLAPSENIYKASMVAMDAGADFIKTSTGKIQPAATPEAALIMCRAIKDFYRETGKRVGFKPAGGISTTNDAMLYLTIVSETLGEEWLNPSLFRIGASRLANNVLSELLSDEIKYF